MPDSQLFEVTIDAARVSTSKRVSRLSRKNCRCLSASRLMDSSLPLPPVLPGPGRARGSARKPPPPARETPPRHSKLVAAGRIHELASRGRIHLDAPPNILVVPSLPAAAPLRTLEESALEEVDDLSVLALDDVSDDDDKSEGDGLLSGDERGLGEGGIGEAPGEFGDIADSAVGVNIDFGVVEEIQSSDESSCISMTGAEATKYPLLERLRHYMGGKQIDTYNRVAVEACIFVEVGTAIKDLEAMKIPVMEELFFTKYLRIVRSIPDKNVLLALNCIQVCWRCMGEQRSLTLDAVCCVSIRLMLERFVNLLFTFQESNPCQNFLAEQHSYRR
jgi:hypothetical protein